MTERSFSSLPLSPGQLSNLESLGYSEMTLIQAAALPPALAGTDLIAQAKTGSGKTAVFSLSLLSRLNPRDFGTQALVLCPTRELASQVATEIRRLARHQQNIKVVTLCGGQSIGPQIGSLERGAHVVVGTPGRIKDHLRKETLSLERVNTLVLDEADRMLDMGFIDDIETIIAKSAKDRQTMLFSATFPDNIQALSNRFQRSPQRVSIGENEASETITQRFYLCPEGGRRDGLERLLLHYQPASAVVFCNTKKTVREVCEHLQQVGIQARALHGDMEQRDRDQAVTLFKHQSCTVLVATDVAARGLDISDLSAVINVELPRDAEVYVHRIGRTGRIGKKGVALSLVTDSEMYRMVAIGDYQHEEFDVEPIASLTITGQPLPSPPFATLLVQAGRKDKVRAGDILGALTGEGGIAGASVGKISITDHASFVGIASKDVEKALQGLRTVKIKGRKFKVRQL